MIAIDYMANADSRFSFAEETEDSQHLSPDDTHPWKILVVDDEEDIHQVTRMVLDDYHYLGRPVFIIDAYSSEQAIEVMREHPDVALILLDVIMESDTAGLELVEVVRNELENSDVRIFIRTGQPGMFNQYQIAAQYNINDFKDKANLQACRDAQDAKRDVQVPLLPSLITTVISFCRSRPASGSLRQSIASSDQTSYPYLKWLNGVSDAYAASPLAQGTTGMLRAAYAYCGLPAFVSLSMAGSDG